MLREVYHAESRFGTFTEQIETQLRATAAAIEQNTSYIGQVNTALNSYTLRQQNFIKTGILENTGASPVFGIDVGLLLQSYTEDDTTFSVTRPKKLRITPEKLSFFDDDTEVAYITSGAIHFPNAVITGGSINIGRRQDGSYNFSVTNEGVLTAKSGTFSGNINGGSININNNFAVTSTGLMTANNAVISDQSWIGKWYVGDFLYYHSNPNGQGDAVTAYFGSGGALIGNNLFWVDGNGEGYFKSDLTVGGDLDVTDIRATARAAEAGGADALRHQQRRRRDVQRPQRQRQRQLRHGQRDERQLLRRGQRHDGDVQQHAFGRKSENRKHDVHRRQPKRQL